MPPKITSLTKDQVSRLDEWRDKWIENGLSTKRSDKSEFERNARICYRLAGLKSDIPIIWTTSPLTGALASALSAQIIQNLSSKKNLKYKTNIDFVVDSAVRSVVDSSIFPAVRNTVVNSIGKAVNLAVDSAINSAISYNVRNDVKDTIGNIVDFEVEKIIDRAVSSAVRYTINLIVRSVVDKVVYSCVGNVIGRTVDRAVGSAIDSAVVNDIHFTFGSFVYSCVENAGGNVASSAVGSTVDSFRKRISWHSWIGGNFWSGWAAYVSFFTDVCDWKPSDDIMARIKAYEGTCKSACYWWPNKDFIMVCERPDFIHRDKMGRLHSENGLTIKWGDGWGLYMWHGTRVTKKIIECPSEITKDDIQNEKNSEISRAIAEKLGWDEYMKRVDVMLINKWFDMNKKNITNSGISKIDLN